MTGPVEAAAKEVADTCLMFALRRGTRSVTSLYDRALAPVGLTAGQFTIVTALGTGEVPSLAALARGLGADRSTLSRLVGPLRRKGLIGPGATRGSLTLTETGQRLFAEALPLWRNAQTSARDRLADEADTLHALLSRL